MTAKAATNVDPLKLVSALIQIGNADTVYRDAYLRRAGTLMAGVLSVEEFQRLEQQTAEVAALPVTIGRALEKGDWPTVKTLSTQAASLRKALEAKRRQIEAGRGVYAVTDVKLDPFSPVCARSRGSPRKACWRFGPRPWSTLPRCNGGMRRGRTSTRGGGQCSKPSR